MTTPDEHRDTPPVVLSTDECLALLGTTTVGRIAFVDEGGQQLVPVNFVLHDGDLYFRTVADGLLAGLAPGHDDIAFGVDHHEDLYRNGWNVTVKGSAVEVTDAATIEAVQRTRLRPWAGGDRNLLVRVRPIEVAGRRVSGR
ncbi:MAG: hypothetical protein JWP31_2092 [Aeromicrobium sp.]|nr:hypothetical protein [Aeromicrobium sp.]